MNVRTKNLKIDGAYELIFRPFSDNRGHFTKLFGHPEVTSIWGDNQSVKQINFSENKRKGTVRGLHFQSYPYEENKMVFCLVGAVYDVILDCRPNSRSFGKHEVIQLCARKNNAVFIPQGVAHGFQTLQDNSSLLYFHENVYQPEHSSGINAFDPDLNLDWPLPVTDCSMGDKALPRFETYKEGLIGL